MTMGSLFRNFSNLNVYSVLTLFIIGVLKVDLSNQYSLGESNCVLPSSWSGLWQNQQEHSLSRFSDNQFASAETGAKTSSLFSRTVDASKFLDKGLCLNNKDERFFFYDKSESCHRCLFIIQRHYNVLQYRETDCYDDIDDFDGLCNLLAPDFPLYTMIRAEAVAEKCPLQDAYTVLSEFAAREPYLNANAFENSIRKLPDTNNKCLKQIEASVISECSDRTMVRLDFQECVRKSHSENGHLHQRRDHFGAQRQVHRENGATDSIYPSLNGANGQQNKGMVSKCIAHWTEGNWNYLILKQEQTLNGFARRRPSFRCAVYQDLDRPFKNTQSNNIINPTNNLIRFSLGDDELCRDFDANSNNFILKKKNVRGSLQGSSAAQSTCSFPKSLNKKWKNLRETKYAFNLHQNTLQILHSNNFTRYYRNHHKFSHDGSIYLKLNCLQELNNEVNEHSSNESVFLVSNLLECSNVNKCLWISQKSDFIMHLKYGYYDQNECLFDEEHLIYEDYLFIETDSGIDCPFSDRVYQLSDDANRYESNKLKRTLADPHSQFNIIYGSRDTRSSLRTSTTDSNCEHYLKIGCSSNVNLYNDYSINKKCQYSFNEQKLYSSVKHLKKKDLIEQYNYESLPQYRGLTKDSVLPVIESESNRICLAYWPIDEKESPTKSFNTGLGFNKYHDQGVSYIVLSKSKNSASFSVTCSLWESYQKDEKLKITDDYISGFCKNNNHKNSKENSKHMNAYYQRQRNINSNEFAIYETNSDEKSFVFDYKGKCGSNGSSRTYELNISFVVLTVFLLLVNLI